MKQISFKKVVFAALLAVAGVGSQAKAAIIPDSWSQTISFGSGVTIPPTRTYDHTLSSFNPFASSILAWTLTLNLVDDGNGTCTDGQCEGIAVNINGSTAATFGNGAIWLPYFGLISFGWNFDTMTEMLGGSGSPLVGGKMTVSIRATYGDVVLKGSKLDAYGATDTTKVPEPATLGLLGLGLLGAGLLRRRTGAR